MNEIVEREITSLLTLLDYAGADIKKITTDLLSNIKNEIVAEIRDGVKDAGKSNDIDDLKKRVDEKIFTKITETAASKILVAFYANAKRDYDEAQKEIFLTFLLTNKLQRELEK